MVYGHLGAAMVFAMVNVSIQIALALVFLEWRLDKVNMLCIVLIQFNYILNKPNGAHLTIIAEYVSHYLCRTRVILYS